MESIEVIYEHGILRPLVPLVLPENARVQIQIVNGETGLVQAELQREGMDEVYDILDRSHETGIADLAARHDEHQP